jgi:hypothetical protein
MGQLMPDDQGVDAFELVRRQNPAPLEEYADLGRTDAARVVMERILAGDTTIAARRRPRWRRRRVVIPVIATVALAASAAGYELSQQVTNPVTIGCYAAASLHAEIVVLGNPGGSYSAACEPVWRHGPLGYSSTPAPLCACVLPSGAVGVFPDRRGSPCAGLGLAAAAPPSPGTAAIVAMAKELTNTARSGSCMTEAAARRDAASAPKRNGLGSWRVVVDVGFGERRSCATFAVDPPSTTVYLVPVPRK